MEIYTDGSYNNQKMIGAWAMITHNFQYSEIIPYKTDISYLELYAVYNAILKFKHHHRLDIYTDSHYVYHHLNNISRNRKCKQEAKNILLKKTKRLIRKHEVEIHKVKAHSNNPMNNIADKLARKTCREYIRREQQ